MDIIFCAFKFLFNEMVFRDRFNMINKKGECELCQLPHCMKCLLKLTSNDMCGIPIAENQGIFDPFKKGEERRERGEITYFYDFSFSLL